MATKKDLRRTRIKKGIRSKIAGTSIRPRLSIFRSNTSVYAQLIDDSKGHTLMTASSRELSDKRSINIETAGQVGKKIAEKAIAAGIDSVVFDRNGYKYHGRIKKFAETLRKNGLIF